ncbi:hypothetical protein EWM64_g5802 [Hericium alpestre]|uniref:Aminoglycoside phosphotransferase domain-containing protein n=1 Tax=Hericium alpestre TaxID=135208 RepID=A0A4Y9ZVL9_9AGAM|nr:hypothetical protein EWM64_g5802 [Hericium alpestre]
MRAQTTTQNHVLCSAAGGAILDPRVPWLEDDPRVFSSTQDFLEQVWLGLDYARNRETLRPMIRPLIQRADIPIVFCHGDTLPKNVLLPGGLEAWREGRSTVCLIDWEYAGWMPLPWDALKATWLCCEPENEWLAMMKGVFPESGAELEADWQWRLLSNVTIL